MDEVERVAAGERQDAGEHLVEGHAERVEVGAAVDHAVHPAGLLGRHVRERPLERLGAYRLLRLLREERRDAEADEMDLERVRVDEEVVRLDVLVDHLAAVELVEDPGRRAGDRQRRLDLQPAGAQEVVERRPARPLEHEREAVPVLLEPVGLDDALDVERAEHVVLVPERRELRALGNSLFRTLKTAGLRSSPQVPSNTSMLEST